MQAMVDRQAEHEKRLGELLNSLKEQEELLKQKTDQLAAVKSESAAAAQQVSRDIRIQSSRVVDPNPNKNMDSESEESHVFSVNKKNCPYCLQEMLATYISKLWNSLFQNKCRQNPYPNPYGCPNPNPKFFFYPNQNPNIN
jgi:hypothetical protein